MHVYVWKALPDQQMEKESLANILAIVQESPMAAKTSGWKFDAELDMYKVSMLLPLRENHSGADTWPTAP